MRFQVSLSRNAINPVSYKKGCNDTLAAMVSSRLYSLFASNSCVSVYRKILHTWSSKVADTTLVISISCECCISVGLIQDHTQDTVNCQQKYTKGFTRSKPLTAPNLSDFQCIELASLYDVGSHHFRCRQTHQVS